MSYLTMFTKAYKSTKRYIGLFITELGGGN